MRRSSNQGRPDCSGWGSLHARAHSLYCYKLLAKVCKVPAFQTTQLTVFPNKPCDLLGAVCKGVEEKLIKSSAPKKPWSVFQNSIIIPSPSSPGQCEASTSVLVAVVERVCICFQKMMYVISNSFSQDSTFTELIDALVTEGACYRSWQPQRLCWQATDKCSVMEQLTPARKILS